MATLTASQLTALKTDILADAAFNGVPMNSDGHTLIAAAYNVAANPAFTVWKTSVGVDEIMNNGFVWTAVDALTAGKARIWDWMTKLGTINPSKANIRSGLSDCFGAASAMATAILPHLKRLALRGERLFATGTGSDAVPGTLVVEGQISAADVGTARELP